MTSSLVGSEMCIRDSPRGVHTPSCLINVLPMTSFRAQPLRWRCLPIPVSYTHLTLPTICSV
eukprot:1313984-Prorocentrum_lima.AAC.1